MLQKITALFLSNCILVFQASLIVNLTFCVYCYGLPNYSLRFFAQNSFLGFFFFFDFIHYTLISASSYYDQVYIVRMGNKVPSFIPKRICQRSSTSSFDGSCFKIMSGIKSFGDIVVTFEFRHFVIISPFHLVVLILFKVVGEIYY